MHAYHLQCCHIDPQLTGRDGHPRLSGTMSCYVFDTTLSLIGQLFAQRSVHHYKASALSLQRLTVNYLRTLESE